MIGLLQPADNAGILLLDVNQSLVWAGISILVCAPFPKRIGHAPILIMTPLLAIVQCIYIMVIMNWTGDVATMALIPTVILAPATALLSASFRNGIAAFLSGGDR